MQPLQGLGPQQLHNNSKNNSQNPGHAQNVPQKPRLQSLHSQRGSSTHGTFPVIALVAWQLHSYHGPVTALVAWQFHTWNASSHCNRSLAIANCTLSVAVPLMPRLQSLHSKLSSSTINSYFSLPAPPLQQGRATVISVWQHIFYNKAGQRAHDCSCKICEHNDQLQF